MTVRTAVKLFSWHPVALTLAGILVMGSVAAAPTLVNNKKAAAAASSGTTTGETSEAEKADQTNGAQGDGQANSDKNTDSADKHANDDKVKVLGLVIVEGEAFSKDEIGYNRVYTRDIVNLYKGKKEIETYRGNTVSDLFTGMIGIYSGDSRNSGALDPNIRGMQGEGRIPVTVDGTEQSITVWRGYAGVNNRNYVDPNLISSIYVEKGPSLNPEVHSGIGGSVAMKTLEVDDIVAPDEKFGMEIKLETGDNSVTPRKNPYENSMDYRDLPHPEAAMMGQWRLYFDGSDRVDPRTSGKNHFFNDKAVRIAAAARQDKFEVMAAYAWRNKGNYFSGKRGAEKYGYQPIASLEDLKNIPPLPAYDPYIAQIGLIQLPGREVANTSLNTESLLLKGTLKLPGDQKIKVGYRQTDSRFGDIMPSRIFGPIVDYAGHLNQVAQWPQSWVKQKAVNLDYALNPEDSKWLNLKASVWTTRNDSKTNSSGGVPGDGLYSDRIFDDKYQTYYYANGGDFTLTDEQRRYFQFINGMLNPDNRKPTSADSTTPNTDGRFNTIDGAAYYTKNNRVGFNLSNRMQISRMLDLTVSGNFQYETLKGSNAYSDFFAHYDRYSDDINNGIVRQQSMADHLALPRNGKRHESNIVFNFKLTPTDWLVVTAGARYAGYSLQDDYVQDFLDTADQVRPVKTDQGFSYEFGRTLTPEEFEIYKSSLAKIKENNKAGRRWSNGLTKDEITVEGSIGSGFKGYYRQGRRIVYPTDTAIPRIVRDCRDVGNSNDYYGDKYCVNPVQWRKDKYGHFNIEDNPLVDGTIDLNEKVVNPDDPDGEKVNKLAVRYRGLIRDPMDDTQKANAAKQTGHGWVPLASASLLLTPNSRAYVRYSESLRYPSLFEGTIGFSNFHGSDPSYGRLGYVWKPEHAKNWEVGYVYNFGHLLTHARYADFRVNYYHNTTEHVIDRDQDYNFYQYDKQLLSGVEVQGRFDTGRVFADLGVVRTLRDEVCDATFADIQNVLPGKSTTPVCQNGGMTANGYLANMIPPRWSVVTNLGSRFLDEKLEIGGRFTYYSRVYDTRYKSLIGAGYLPTQIGDPALRWQPVAVYDAYVRYKVNKNLVVELTGNNLTNLYYLDPMSRSYVPAPGRTLRMSLAAKF